jgi:hypothetical protein
MHEKESGSDNDKWRAICRNSDVRDGITNSKRVAAIVKRRAGREYTYLSAGESRLANRAARLSVAASTITASSIAAVVTVVLSISSTGPSAQSSKLSADSSPDAASAGVARPLCVDVTLSITLTFVAFFSLYKRNGDVENVWNAQLTPIKKIDGD